MKNSNIIALLEGILKDVNIANDFQHAQTSAQSKLEMLINILEMEE